MGTIQGGIAKVATTNNDNLAIAIENAQTLVIQATQQDVLMAYSEAGLNFTGSTLTIQDSATGSGTNASSGLVLNFPHKPFSGTLYFRSTSSSQAAEVTIWSIPCGKMSGVY